MQRKEYMIEKIRRITNTKIFHLVMVIVIITVILFFSGIIILRYNVEGETNMPFELTKISVISQVDGEEKEVTNANNHFAFNVFENNDIYLYIDKNENYDQEETIKSIIVNNISLETAPQIGIAKFYHPDAVEVETIFKNSVENECNSVEYVGEVQSDLKNMKISNQGGIVAFRYSIQDITNYETSEIEIERSKLLSKAQISNESIKSKLKFDLNISLDSGKMFQTTISLKLPIDDVVSSGVTSKEFNDMDSYIFKRIQN